MIIPKYWDKDKDKDKKDLQINITDLKLPLTK
jgi:hypothetical protein